MTLTSFLCFLISQLWGRGVETRDIVVVVLVVLIQILGGGLLWVVLSERFQMKQIEFFSMGLAIGSILATVIDQFLLDTQLEGFGALVLLVSAVAWMTLRKLWNGFRINSSPPEVALLILLASLIPLATDEAATTPATILMGLGMLICRLIQSQRVALAFSALTIIASALATRLFLRTFADGGDALSPLFYTASDDQIKSEQLAYSISKWGLETNSAAVNLPIKFHWLSLGWAGGLMQMGNIDPYVVTLHVIPLLILVCLSALLVSIAHEMNLGQLVIHLAPFLLLAAANGDREFRFFFVMTTTNLVPHVWILGLVLVLLLYEQSRKVRLLSLIPLLSVAVLLGKGPYGVVIVIGLIGSLAFSYCQKSRSGSIEFKYRIAVYLAILMSGIAYVYYLRSPLTDSYYFSFSEFINRFPFPLPGVSGNLLLSGVVGGLVLATFVLTRFTWVFQPSALLSSRLGWFTACSAIAGIFSFLFKQVGSETYFANAALTLSVVALLIVFGTSQFSKVQINGSQLVGLIGLLSALMWVVRNASDDARILIVISLLSAVAFGLAVSRTWRIRSTVALALVFALIPIANGVSSLKFKQNNRFEIISAEELSVFDWIRLNTSASSIFITNRYLCDETVRCGSGMPVAASLTRRRFLVEGARTLTPTRMWDGPYPLQLRKEVTISLQFFELPTSSLIRNLKQMGVTHALIFGEATNSQHLLANSRLFGTQNISVYEL